MDTVIHPALLYSLIAIGAVGVVIAMPRRGPNPSIIGALIAAAAGGGVIAALSLSDLGAIPNVHFYIFSAIALGAALRVITHPRPVYAALYFILTILSSAGLYLLLSAEFMAFALIIIYAGAILITYLFVIMLATQAPREDQVEALADYDLTSREPVFATASGFVLLAALTTMLFAGTSSLPQDGASGRVAQTEAKMALLPARVEAALRDAGTMAEGDELVMIEGTGEVDMNLPARTVQVLRAGEGDDAGVVETVPLPEDLKLRNVEALAFNFLNEHPVTIEIAGIILMMAMLGATVLSRKQVQLDEDEKAKQATMLAEAQASEQGPAGAGPVPAGVPQQPTGGDA
ncbi:MAG: NADH-quinone oxidoreductase subunit J [Planctomycetota bacterium]